MIVVILLSMLVSAISIAAMEYMLYECMMVSKELFAEQNPEHL